MRRAGVRRFDEVLALSDPARNLRLSRYSQEARIRRPADAESSSGLTSGRRLYPPECPAGDTGSSQSQDVTGIHLVGTLSAIASGAKMTRALQ